MWETTPIIHVELFSLSLVMALFGFHFVLTMIVASVVHKLAPYYSFGRWLVTKGLKYYAVPNDSALQSHIATDLDSTTRNRHKTNTINDDMLIKRTSSIPLNPQPLSPVVVLLIYYYTELKWLMDLLVAVLFVYIVTFIAYCIKPSWHSSQVNLSAAWTGFILVYTLILLYSITMIYLSDELPKERVAQIVLSAILFVSLLGVLLLDEIFDFNLREGHSQFVEAFIVTINGTIDRELVVQFIPYWFYIAVLVVMGTLIGSVLVFPSLNYSQLHFETLRHNKSYLKRLLLHFNYILPLICLSLWFKPMPGKTSIVAQKMVESFPMYRVVLIFLLCSSRLLLFRLHMGTYLNRANYSLTSLRAAGKSKVTVGEFKKKVKSILSFYCGAAVQYVGPVIVLMSFHMLSVASSGYVGMFETVQQFPGLFCLSVYCGPLSFLCWWTCFVMFFVSSIASLAYTYLM